MKLHCVLIDIDECETAVDNCEHVCLNTIGSFHCACQSGYTLNTFNNRTCNGKFNKLINQHRFLLSYKILMSVMMGVLVVVNYVVILLEAMFVLVSMDINLIMTTILVMVKICQHCKMENTVFSK